MNKEKISSRNRGTWLLSLVIVCMLLIGGAVSLKSQFSDYIDDAYTSLSYSLHSIKSLIGFQSALQDAYNSFDLNEGKLFTKVSKIYFEEFGVSEETLTDYAEEMEDCAIYFYGKDGSIITSEDAEELPLPGGILVCLSERILTL